MGDRTTVKLTLLASQKEAALAFFDEGPEDEDPYGDLVEFSFYEVNYGKLDFLEKLQNAGIAYDSQWDAGGDYGAGTESCRFTDTGETINKQLYDDCMGIAVDTLIPVIHDLLALQKIILDKQEELAVLPWNNQEANGKLYRMKQLIT